MTVNPKALARSATADPIRPKFSIKVTNFPSFISFHYKLSIECDQLSALAKFAFAEEQQQQSSTTTTSLSSEISKVSVSQFPRKFSFILSQCLKMAKKSRDEIFT